MTISASSLTGDVDSSPSARIGDLASINNLILGITAHFDQARVTVSSQCLSGAIYLNIADSGIGAPIAIVPYCYFLTVRFRCEKVT